MDTLFWIAALTGTIAFGLKLLLSFFGGAEVAELGDVETNGTDHGSDNAFKLISIHSLTGFFMMFGWAGLACYKQYALPAPLSLLLATAVGVFMMFAAAYMFKIAGLAASPGTTFRTEELVGRRATVYHKIPAAGAGKIQITVNGYLREVRAVAANGQEIASFSEVIIVKVLDETTVSVNPIIS